MGLAEKDRSFDSTDNIFDFELGNKPVSYFAVGFPGGADERSLTLSQCILAQRLWYTLNFKNTCYLHGMSGGPVYASDPGSEQGHDVVALNTELGVTLDERIMSNASVTSTQRGVGTLAAVFAQAAWRASHFQTPDGPELALVNAQVTKLGGGSGDAMNASQRASFVSRYISGNELLHLCGQVQLVW